MTIVEDKAQQKGKHENKHVYWDKQGINYIPIPLPCGDYVLMNDKIQDVINRKAKRGIEVKKMDLLGTYDVVVDTKKDIQEIIGDICGKQHDRFRDECILAQNNGIKLIILIENRGEYLDTKKTIYQPTVRSIGELFHWRNKRAFMWRNGKQLYPNCTKGAALAKAMNTMNLKYGVEFQFCLPEESGKRIIELLGGNNNDN